MFFERALGAESAALMLRRRFQTKRDGAGEVIGIHAAGQGVLYVRQRLIELTPAHGDGFDLDMPLGAKSTGDHSIMWRST